MEDSPRQYYRSRHSIKHTPGGKLLYDETFFIQSQSPSGISLLDCFACGDCKWENSYGYTTVAGRGHWAFEFITAGRCSIRQEKCQITGKAGDLLLLRSNGEYKLSVPKGDTYQKICLILNENNLSDILLNSIFPPEEFLIRLKNPQTVHRLFLEILDCLQSQRETVFIDASTLCYRIIYELHRQIVEKRYPSSLRAALNYMEQQHRICTRTEIAEAGGASISTMNRLFRKYLNCSPAQYQIKLRLEHANSLLRLNEISIKTLAEECGFSSSSFFCREFKQHYGCSPGRFREQCHNQPLHEKST